MPIVRMPLRGGPDGAPGLAPLRQGAAADRRCFRAARAPACSTMSEGQGRLSVGVDAILSNTTMPLNKTKVSSSRRSRSAGGTSPRCSCRAARNSRRDDSSSAGAVSARQPTAQAAAGCRAGAV